MKGLVLVAGIALLASGPLVWAQAPAAEDHEAHHPPQTAAPVPSPPAPQAQPKAPQTGQMPGAMMTSCPMMSGGQATQGGTANCPMMSGQGGQMRPGGMMQQSPTPPSPK